MMNQVSEQCTLMTFASAPVHSGQDAEALIPEPKAGRVMELARFKGD